MADAIKLLMDDGAVVAADRALTNQQGFNRELIGGIIYVINETNLGRAGDAYSRMKEFVTNPEIWIHPKGGTPFKVKNWSRCIQTANDVSYCPVGFDDERVIVIQMNKLDKNKVIDWENELKPALISERGQFLHALQSYELPPPAGRCFLPILNTDAKLESIESNLPTLNDEQGDWLQQVMELVEQDKWTGMLTFKEIQKLLTVPPGHTNSWLAAWKVMDLHFRNVGLIPDSRRFVKNGPNKGPAAWGFQS